MRKTKEKKSGNKIDHLHRTSRALAEIFDSTGLSREDLARELGVKRDAVQRMIRAAAVPLERFPVVQRLSRVEFDFEQSDDGLRVVGFKIKKHLAIIKEPSKHSLMAARRTEVKMSDDLSQHSDLALKRELERRGWIVSEPSTKTQDSRTEK